MRDEEEEGGGQERGCEESVREGGGLTPAHGGSWKPAWMVSIITIDTVSEISAPQSGQSAAEPSVSLSVPRKPENPWPHASVAAVAALP